MDKISVVGPPGGYRGGGECRGKQFPHMIILPELFDGSEEAEKPVSDA